MHANVIARRTIKVDGDLSDWKGVASSDSSGVWNLGKPDGEGVLAVRGHG